MEGNISEKIKCPICFEIPQKEIYQCLNGHTVCNNCSRELSNCPQCRVKYEAKIRNRALEELLDMMTFDCFYSSKGCKNKLKRSDLSSHIDDCSFGEVGTKFCQLLGFSCEHFMNTCKLNEMLIHCQKHHGFVITRETDFNILLEGIEEFSRTSQSMSSPVIVDLENSLGLVCIIINAFNKEDKSISPICIPFNVSNDQPYVSSFRVEFKIDAIKANEVPETIFNISPVNWRNTKYLVNHPIVRLPLKTLVASCMTDNVITMTCFIQQILTRPVSLKRETISTMNILLDLTQEADHPTASHVSMAGNSRINCAMRLGMRRVLPVNSHGVLFSGCWCNICRDTPVSARYKCLECLDYDLCSECMERGEHHGLIVKLLK